jgi:hypothetical protein
MTIELLRQASHESEGAGFVIGITENVPAGVLVDSFTTIAKALNAHGRCPLKPES